MMDDLRNHDSRPDDTEREWMDSRPGAMLRRGAVLAVLAILIGHGVSAVVGRHADTPDRTVSVKSASSDAASPAGSTVSSR